MAQDVLLDPDQARHDDEDPDLAFMDDAVANTADTLAVSASPMSDARPVEDDEAVLTAAAARRSALHDRERDVRLGRLHGKGRKSRPLYTDD